MSKKFKIPGRVAVITGGAGLLGAMHAEAIAENQGIPILFDKDFRKAKIIAKHIENKFKVKCLPFNGDVTKEKDINNLIKYLKIKKLKIDILINNAALNPKLNKKGNNGALENLKLKDWNMELNVGLTGMFLCSKMIGKIMIKNKKGVIINISSDLGLISPDQRLYKKKNRNLFYKPITYSVIKHGVIGLTKYMATYWSAKGIRVNCLCPGGVYEKQEKSFLQKISKKIPLGRMANQNEYKGAIQFLASDASSYMNGANLVIDGGRSIW
jgi:NAD(P)-dependent dehydrogenase (short-subunit alcohol dehydrogenase family)